MKIESGSTRLQLGALPYRLAQDGSFEVMLVTSRETRRWVIPKGWPMKNHKPFAAAAREAYEEAGITGVIGKRAVGSFTYEKRLKTQLFVACRVDVYLLDVRREAERWPERRQRERQWFSLDAAAEHVVEPELAEIIRALPEFTRTAEEETRRAQAAPE